MLRITLWYAGLVLLLMVPAPSVQADGCVIDRFGRYVLEREQLAFIEWENGQERLFVATRTDPSSEPSLWIVPVPANPERVRAEPVEKFPRVIYQQSIVDRAKVRLDEAIERTCMLDSGLGLLTLWGLGSPASSNFMGVREHQRVEKLGMVVVVLTAQSPEVLDRYLAANQVSAQGGNLKALEPYLGKDQEYALICGWAAQSGKSVSARALQIDFPAPQAFFPLQPTRVYESEVATAIFLRGHFRPPSGFALDGLHCQYLRGAVNEVDLLFESPRGFRGPPVPLAKLEPLTRIELKTPPAQWTKDLVLEPGAPVAIAVAQLIDAQGVGILWGGSAVLGMLLGFSLPWVVIPPEKRRWTDWLWAGLVGSSIVLSIFVAVLAFSCWRYSKVVGHELPVREGESTGMVLGGSGLGVALILVCVIGSLSGLSEMWIVAAGMAGFFMVAVFLLVSMNTVRNFRKLGWLALFAVVHSGLVCVICLGLREWFNAHG